MDTIIFIVVLAIFVIIYVGVQAIQCICYLKDEVDRLNHVVKELAKEIRTLKRRG